LEGISYVVITFEIGTPMDAALNDVRAKVDKIIKDLPKDIDKPSIDKLDTTSEPILDLSLESPDYNSQELRDLIDNVLKDRFARIPGVSQVSVTGGDVREIHVRFKKDQLLKYELGIVDLTRALNASTLNISSGHIVDGNKEYAVRVLGEFTNVNQIRNLMISKRDPKNPLAKPIPVRLSDIADVHDTIAEPRSKGRLNGHPSINLYIRKTTEGNAVEISKRVDEVIKEIKNEYNVRTTKTYDDAEKIEEGLFDLNVAIMFGILLVAIVVYVFLHNFRGTLIVCVAIPVTIFASFIAMKLFGFTINNLSMLALSLSIGVLVDDAIVVLENIYRHLKLGEEPLTAAINGRSEIGLAAIAITLADVVVFLPIGFMGGIVGEFFRPLGIVYSVVVLLSLLVSFTLTPMMASRWYRSGENFEEPKGRFARAFENGFHKFEHFYRNILEWALRHRWFVFITGFGVLVAVFVMLAGSSAPNLFGAFGVGTNMFIVCALLGILVWFINILRGYCKSRFIFNGMFYGLGFVVVALLGFLYAQWKNEELFKFAFFPPSDSGRVKISIELAPGSSLEASDKIVKQVEQIVAKHPDVEYIVSSIGAEAGGTFQSLDIGTNLSSVTATLYPKKSLLDVFLPPKHEERLRTRPDTSVAADITESIGKIPGADITVAAVDPYGIGAAIQMSFLSDNRELLTKTVNTVKNKLRDGAIAGVINPETSTKGGKPEMRALPDKMRLADVGVTTSELANAVSNFYEGNKNTKYRVSGREYNIRTLLAYEERDKPSIFKQLPVVFSQGQPIFISSVADFERAIGPDKIERRDRTEEIRISADLLPGYAAGTVQEQINRWLEKEKLIPKGVTMKPLGQADIQAQESGYLFSALILGLTLVYMLLASLYNNLLYPFIIQLAQPQAMVGALLALILVNKTLNIVGFIGIITLVGLVGKNAILLVDYTNTLRGRGLSRHDALVQAGQTRLRPIMMTTLALIFGLLPVALAIGRGSEFRETLGIVIIGGMTLSTILTLVVIPCSYTIVDDISNSIGGFLRRSLHREQENSI
jgi:HAE1 family hydrophobic/amphiphilic exporter-1